MMHHLKRLLLVTVLGGVGSSYVLIQNPAPDATAVPLRPQQLRLSQAPTTATLEQSVFDQINQYRVGRGLPRLTQDDRIAKQSRNHSQAMANGQVAFGHAGFQERVKVIGTQIPLRGAAENVAYNKGAKDPAKQAVDGWLKSSGHRSNIEGDFNLTGVGVALNSKDEYYFTQIFIRQR
ncbi:MAG: CAP domain-containing protein [Leptolyngbyaceae cyanobacterium]